MSDAWDPGQYDRFKAERSAPFHDLVALIEPVDGPDVVDLGCGTGELTATLPATLGTKTLLGIDRSERMLEQAAVRTGPGLTFELGDIAQFDQPESWDIVLANAALQWLPDHPDVLARWTAALRSGGQLAVQMPANADHPSHLVSAAIAEEEPFLSALGGTPPDDPVSRNVLTPEEYSALLYRLGYKRQHVRLQVYPHVLPSTADVVEWTKGTSLTRFRERLDDETYDAFVDAYRDRLVAELGDEQPFLYTFKRILIWGCR
jgi:trans-aconitate 2-methyltransferase